MAPRKRLGEMLVEAGIIDEDQLHAALRHQRQWGGRIGAILVELKLASEEAIVDALAVKLGLEIARLDRLEPYAFEQAKGLVPREWAIRNRVFPIAADTGHLVVAMSDPSNLALTDELAFRTGRRVKACIAGEHAIDAALRAHLGAEAPGQREAIALDVEEDVEAETLLDPIGATSSEQLDQLFRQGAAGPGQRPAAPARTAAAPRTPAARPAAARPAAAAVAAQDRPPAPPELQLEDQRTEGIPLVPATPIDTPEEAQQPIHLEPPAQALHAPQAWQAEPERGPQVPQAAGGGRAQQAAPEAVHARAQEAVWSEQAAGAGRAQQVAPEAAHARAQEAAWSEQAAGDGADGTGAQEGVRELTPEEMELLEALRRLAAGDDSAAALLPRARLLGALLRIMLRRQWITEQELLDELLHG